VIERRHVKAALKAMTVKTDRNDTRGMVQLIHIGFSIRLMPKGCRRHAIFVPYPPAGLGGRTCLFECVVATTTMGFDVSQ
jgi:hypothetical protein